MELFREYWWLIFPIMGFAFAAFGMVMGFAMQRDRMRLLRTYAEKGQAPPPELAPELGPYGYGDPGPYGYGWGDRHARRAWRRQMRWQARGPYWGARRSFFFLAFFVVFAVFAWQDGNRHWSHGSIFLAVIFGGLFLSSLLSFLPMVWDRRERDAQLGRDPMGSGSAGK